MYRASSHWRGSSYNKSWLIKLAVLLVPALAYGVVLITVLGSGSWETLPFFLFLLLTSVTAAVLIIIRRKRPRLCYRNRNCVFCPFSCGGIEGLNRDLWLVMPRLDQWQEWSDRSTRYINPILQALSRHTSSQFVVLSSGGSGERCAVPFDVNHSKCIGQKLCYSTSDVTPLRSDHDAMLIPDVFADEYGSGASHPSAQFGILTGNGIPDGFAQLVIKDHTSMHAWAPYCFQQNGWYYLATDNIRELTMSAVRSVRIGMYPGTRTCVDCACGLLEHVGGRIVSVEEVGPAVKLNIEDDQIPWWSLLLSFCCCMPACPLCCAMSDSTRRVYFEADLIISIWCPVWPACANEWKSRARHWPPPDVAANIVSSGCHLVPKPSRPDLSSRLNWRWSFSLGEVVLSYAYPQRAKSCYLLFKIMRSTYLKYKCPYLKTYHLKTILLWTLERNPPEVWTENNIPACVHLLLDELIGCVESRVCPNYWLPRVNLFADLQESVASDLCVRLRVIKANPDVYFANCGANCCGHHMLNMFNVLIIGPLFLFMFTAMIILIGELSVPAFNNYSNSSMLNATDNETITDYEW